MNENKTITDLCAMTIIKIMLLWQRAARCSLHWNFSLFYVFCSYPESHTGLVPLQFLQWGCLMKVASWAAHTDFRVALNRFDTQRYQPGMLITILYCPALETFVWLVLIATGQTDVYAGVYGDRVGGGNLFVPGTNESRAKDWTCNKDCFIIAHSIKTYKTSNFECWC